MFGINPSVSSNLSLNNFISTLLSVTFWQLRLLAPSLDFLFVREGVLNDVYRVEDSGRGALQYMFRWCRHAYRAFFHSVAMFCHGFQFNLRGPAWAVGSCSISQPAEGTFQNVIFQTLRQCGRNALLFMKACGYLFSKMHTTIGLLRRVVLATK